MVKDSVNKFLRDRFDGLGLISLGPALLQTTNRLKGLIDSRWQHLTFYRPAEYLHDVVNLPIDRPARVTRLVDQAFAKFLKSLGTERDSLHVAALLSEGLEALLDEVKFFLVALVVFMGIAPIGANQIED